MASRRILHAWGSVLFVVVSGYGNIEQDGDAGKRFGPRLTSGAEGDRTN